MSAPRRTRVAAVAAALCSALVVGGFVGTAGIAFAAEDLDCSDFDFQEDAQAVLDANRSDPHRLDGGRDGGSDGVACESLPRRGGDADADDEDDEDAPATTPAAAASADDEDGDRDCADFATQAAAQAALVSSPGDEERLDSDDDGIACEQHFGTDGRQVAVFPQGGVATGGTARP